jgi:hypothetical protein
VAFKSLRTVATRQLSGSLNTFGFVDPFFHKIIIKDELYWHWYKDEYNPDWSFLVLAVLRVELRASTCALPLDPQFLSPWICSYILLSTRFTFFF